MSCKSVSVFQEQGIQTPGTSPSDPPSTEEGGHDMRSPRLGSIHPVWSPVCRWLFGLTESQPVSLSFILMQPMGTTKWQSSSELLSDTDDACHVESVSHLQDLILGSGPCFSQGTDSVGARRISTDIPQKCGPATVTFMADRKSGGLASVDNQYVPSVNGCSSLRWEPLPPAHLPY